MSRRDNAELRCPDCRLHRALCLCDLVPALPTASRLLLVVHKDEAHKPTNTGLLAARCLPNSVVVTAGDDGPIAAPAERAVLLFPSEGARTLVAADGPLTLVVPDGTWRQARKIRGRSPGLSALECVTLPPGAPTTYRLRTEGRQEGLSTLEAIARAFGILEGPAVEAALLAVQRVMVDRTLWLRGTLRDHEVEGGIPEAARRHDPRGGLPRT